MDHFEDISGEPIVGIPSPSGLGFEATNDPGIPFQSYTSFSGGVVDLGSPERLMWPILKPGAFSVWFRPQGTGANGRLYSAENNECCGDIEFRASSSTAEAAAIVVNMLGISTIISVPYEDWTHMVISANSFGTDSVQCSMYLNGDLYLEQSPAPANYDLPSYLPNGYDDMFIGQKAAPGWDKWGGDAAHMAWFDRGLTLDEINYLFTGNLSVGCTDPNACNYVDTATEDSGNCDYGCCPGPGCCSEGMFWDWDSLACYVSKPADINMDGCVQLNDLLDLLSAYGDCALAEWACGDPLEYQGYDYETVLIEDQCWFAENVRHLPSVSPADLGSEDDGLPHAYVTGYSGTDIYEAVSTENHLAYGALYNFAAVIQWQLCPSGWHVPSDGDWASSLDTPNWNGTELRSLTWNGTNQSGFNALPGGFRDAGGFFNESSGADFWTSTEFDASFAQRRYLLTTSEALEGTNDPRWKSHAFSVRCVKDAE